MSCRLESKFKMNIKRLLAKRDQRMLVLSPKTSDALLARMYPNSTPPLLGDLSTQIDKLHCDLASVIRLHFDKISESRAQHRMEFYKTLSARHKLMRKMRNSRVSSLRVEKGVVEAVTMWNEFINTCGQSFVVFEDNKTPVIVRGLEPELPRRFKRHFLNTTNISIANIYRKTEYSRRLVMLYDAFIMPIPEVGGYSFLRKTGELVRVTKVYHVYPYLRVFYEVQGSDKTGDLPVEYFTPCHEACLESVDKNSANARKREKLMALQGGKLADMVTICRRSVYELTDKARKRIFRDVPKSSLYDPLDESMLSLVRPNKN